VFSRHVRHRFRASRQPSASGSKPVAHVQCAKIVFSLMNPARNCPVGQADWWLGLHQSPWSFGFNSQTRGTRENRAQPCVKVPGSSRVPAPPWVGSRSPDGWDQIPRWAGGWVLHQPPWSFGFDSQTFPSPPPPSFRERVLFIGTQFSNLYTAVDTPARGRVVVCLVFVCKYVLGRSRVSQPLNLRLCLLWHLGFLTSPHASPTCCRRRLNSDRLLRRSTPGPPPIPWAHLFHLPASPRPPLYTATMTT
jgi:hypothetical protein